MRDGGCSGRLGWRLARGVYPLKEERGGGGCFAVIGKREGEWAGGAEVHREEKLDGTVAAKMVLWWADGGQVKEVSCVECAK